MRLLLVEDDVDVAETLVSYLEKHGYVVDLAPTLAIAKTAVMANSFDLVLLDRLLPDGEGMSMLRFFADNKCPQRVILLTALGDVDDRVRGLEAGAHDYIPKPFEPRELLARIRNTLRQPMQTAREVKTLGPLSYDVESRAFSINGEALNLRRTEALVLEALMSRPGSLVTREALESKVYGYDKFVTSNSLESQVSRLRKNLAEHTDKIKIQTVRGLGYSLNAT
ncbi:MULTISPECIES: response regulator transcription factor [Shewanella]|jgi:DNA-binding response OmpR family regulator|uniref:Winged helix family two component transcriptional regulator n=1 Tax=Shewanella fodinae TaxID=552357 RepID=A0A4R2F7B6_9GAMM|nr:MULTISPECIES: response regulator transcription factor [Shewanella]MBO1271744.1 response regulator transcription factor [Shewanella sp. 4t3-1-2LB]TCN82822.1 winged helix family two component transcriptional regulator [Shewanella fodinae]